MFYLFLFDKAFLLLYADNTSSGLIISSQMMGYTVVKFLGGTLADIVDSGLTFSMCLMMSAFCTMGVTGKTILTFFT